MLLTSFPHLTLIWLKWDQCLQYYLLIQNASIMYNPQSYILTSKISLHLPISFMVRLSSFYLLLGFCIFFWPTYYLSYISHYHSNLKDFHPSTFLMKSSHHITFHIPHSVCPNLNFIMQIIHAFAFVYPELCMLGFPSHTSTVDQAILPASVMYTLHKFSSISRVCIASLIFLSQDFFFQLQVFHDDSHWRLLPNS